MSLQIYFLIFVFYAFLGWILESCYSLVKTKKVINRGFLLGPWIPIYGFGALAITVFLGKYTEDLIVLFVMSMVVCSILEYLTSYILEKIFNVRWWDYNDMKYNINGRICLETMIPFGILGLIMIYIINPFILNVLNDVSSFSLNLISIILLIFLLLDIFISFRFAFSLKTIRFKIDSDNTEEINKVIKKKLKAHYKGLKLLYSRLEHAFPKLLWKRKNHK